MVILYDIGFFLGYFALMLLFMFIAIVVAKTKASWIIFAVGAAIQLFSMAGNEKNGSGTPLYWILYFLILIVSFLIIVNIKNKQIDEKIKACKKDSDNVLNMYIDIFEKACSSGDFSELFPFLDDYCKYETQWEKEKQIGKSSVISLLKNKGEKMINESSFPECKKIRLVGKLYNSDDFKLSESTYRSEALSKSGEVCLLLSQKNKDATHKAILRIELNELNSIAKLYVCEPSFYKYEEINETNR